MVLMIISVGGYILAISNPKRGGIVMIAGGVFMVVYLLIISGLGEFKMSLIFGLPFIFPGLVLFFNRQKRS
jgi:drug/metabolite transporter (DMT)-like permease